MPRRETHASVALGIPLLIWVIVGSKILNSTFMISSALFFFGNLAPDYMEPSYYFTHRGFYHSQKLLKILAIFTAIVAILWMIFWIILKSQFFLFIISFPAGYIVHLLLDSTSKMGLPKDNNPIGFR